MAGSDKKVRFSLSQIDEIDKVFMPLLKFEKKLWDNTSMAAKKKKNKLHAIYLQIIPGLRSKGKIVIENVSEFLK